MKFSIIIPVKELNDYLLESVPKILSMNYSDYEIIILPNEKSKKIPKKFKNKKVRIIPSGRVSPALKRDLGAKKAKGEYLAFLDDDAYPKKDWLKIAEKSLKKEVCVVGPAITPKKDSVFQKVSGLFFETIAGGGMSYRYISASKSFYVDDYPTVNFIISKKVFWEVGGFDNNYWPGEDTKICLDLINKGHKILYNPNLIVYHHRRPIFLPHLKQVGSYGKHRGYFAKKFPKTSFRITYFIPSTFFIINIFLFLSSFFNPLFFQTWIIMTIIYFLFFTIIILKKTLNPFLILLTIITSYLTHLIYGAMFIKGLLTKNFRSKLR